MASSLHHSFLTTVSTLCILSVFSCSSNAQLDTAKPKERRDSKKRVYSPNRSPFPGDVFGESPSRTRRSGQKSEKVQTQVFRLKRRAPASIRDLILGLPTGQLNLDDRQWEGFRVAADGPSKCILARGTKVQLGVVQEIVKAFDVDDLSSFRKFGTMRFYQLNERAPDEIAGIIQQLEIPVHVLLPQPASADEFDFGALDAGALDAGALDPGAVSSTSAPQSPQANANTEYDTLVKWLLKEANGQTILAVCAKPAPQTPEGDPLAEVTKLLEDMGVLGGQERPKEVLDDLFGQPASATSRDNLFE